MYVTSYELGKDGVRNDTLLRISKLMFRYPLETEIDSPVVQVLNGSNDTALARAPTADLFLSFIREKMSSSTSNVATLAAVYQLYETRTSRTSWRSDLA